MPRNLPPHVSKALYQQFGPKADDAIITKMYHNVWEVSLASKHFLVHLITFPRGTQVRIAETIYTSIQAN